MLQRTTFFKALLLLYALPLNAVIGVEDELPLPFFFQRLDSCDMSTFSQPQSSPSNRPTKRGPHSGNRRALNMFSWPPSHKPAIRIHIWKEETVQGYSASYGLQMAQKIAVALLKSTYSLLYGASDIKGASAHRLLLISAVLRLISKI